MEGESNLFASHIPSAWWADGRLQEHVWRSWLKGVKSYEEESVLFEATTNKWLKKRENGGN